VKVCFPDVTQRSSLFLDVEAAGRPVRRPDDHEKGFPMVSRPGRITDTHGYHPPGRDRELKQQRAVQTRERILNAAAEAFAQYGYADVTLMDIAELTGMTKGAVYFHFKNKEALAVAVAEEFYRRLSADAEAVARLGLPPLQSVIEFLSQTALSFHDEVLMQAGARLQLEHSLVSAPLPPPYVAFTGVIESWLEQAASAGEPLPRGVEPRVLTRVLVEAFFGAQHISWVQNGRADIMDRADEIIRIVLRAEPRVRK
jgi:AcrR family transcriptional regulator